VSKVVFRFADLDFTEVDLQEIREVITMFSSLSRREMAATIGETIGLLAHTGQPKIDLCLRLLDELEAKTDMEPPAKRKKAPPRKPIKRGVQITEATAPKPLVSGDVSELTSLQMELVLEKAHRKLWNEYVDRYHPLGYRVPFGAQQPYFIQSEKGYLGCLLFSASAWALADRDSWIGWTERDRAKRLHLVINNSRFLIFPWVRVKNLASKALAMIARRVQSDWEDRYGYSPVLMETFVDIEFYQGICYKAANWQYIGETKGRGRMDRYTKYLSSPKHIYVYSLSSDFRRILCGEMEI